jgi:HK97 family phage portal protein
MGFLEKLISPTNIKEQTHRDYNEIIFKALRVATGLPFSNSKEDLVQKGYTQNATVFSIVSYLSNAGANVPICVYRKTVNGFVKANDSELASTLKRPNPDMGYTQWMGEVLGYYYLTGDSYIQGVRPDFGENADVIQQLYVLPSQYMELVVSGKMVNPIEGYRLILNQQKSDLPYEDVAHVKTFNPDFSSDGRQLYGQSPLQAAYRNLTINNDAITTGQNFLKNQGVRGILTPDDMLGITQDQAQAVKNRYKKQYQGADNAGEIMITNQAFKWFELGMPAADLALIEQYNLSKKDIAAAYNFPSLLLNDSEEFSVSTYREAKKQMYLQRVIPDLCNIRDELNRWLVPTYNKRYKEDFYIDFDWNKITEIQEDQEKVVNQLSKAWWLTPNEKREIMMMERLNEDGMDDIHIPANLIDMGTAIDGEMLGGNPNEPRD